MLRKYIVQYKSTIAYLALIVLLSKMFEISPRFSFLEEIFSPFDAVVGAVYLFRNFSQREVGHWIVVLMIFAGFLSHLVADVPYASTFAFLGGELVDLFIFSYLRLPLVDRLFWAATLSTPIDSLIFLYMNENLNWVTISFMTGTKLITIILILLVWEYFYGEKVKATN